ncbi:interferon gamma receptor 1-like protein [Labeo rohita]|uniref:Interferon gamma receptor 1-like protein n=1 Tax=Labeo rohita TaxID=84645 RepID=A0A498P3R0_LABRO|nr:interferon gamma receptor 1-like protein [Labeo rohita]
MTMKMAKNHVVQFGVFYALLLPVCGYVPSPTNISVVCHNFVNVLYWNYSNPTEQLKFSVNIKPYESVSQSVDTSQMYLDISSYSRDAGDDYFVSVTAHDGQEKSESVSIRFTYSKDFFDENKHKYKLPSPTNVSLVCHNFVNVLYWNYSNPTEQLKFSVNIDPYVSDSQTVDTSQTYLDISNYSRDAGDDYIVSVTAHDGPEKSESVSYKFTYSKDFFDKNKHKCSLDFPAVNTSVHKDVIKASFQHPFLLHKQDILKEEFTYTVTHDEKKFSYLCCVKDELCTAEIHLNESIAGQCEKLIFDGKIAGIPSYTYRNVCDHQQTAETDKTGLISALLGGGTIMLLIMMGVVWLLCKKWSKIPKIPEVLRSLIPGQSPTTQAELTDVSQMTSQRHTPQLTGESYDPLPIPLMKEVCEADTTVPTGDSTVVDLPEEVSEEDVNDDDSEGFCRSSDYDSPKFLQEMSPGDLTEGYGPRPPVL